MTTELANQVTLPNFLQRLVTKPIHKIRQRTNHYLQTQALVYTSFNYFNGKYSTKKIHFSLLRLIYFSHFLRNNLTPLFCNQETNFKFKSTE